MTEREMLDAVMERCCVNYWKADDQLKNIVTPDKDPTPDESLGILGEASILVGEQAAYMTIYAFIKELECME